jgi:hypothetical protein
LSRRGRLFQYEMGSAYLSLISECFPFHVSAKVTESGHTAGKSSQVAGSGSTARWQIAISQLLPCLGVASVTGGHQTNAGSFQVIGSGSTAVGSSYIDGSEYNAGGRLQSAWSALRRYCNGTSPNQAQIVPFHVTKVKWDRYRLSSK